MKRLLTILFVAALLAGGLAAPASADLVEVGPVNPVTAFPSDYLDINGLRLQLCDDFDPNAIPLAEQPPCGIEIIDPTLEPDPVVAGNIGEALFYGATAEFPGPTGESILAICAVEAAGGAPDSVSNIALLRIDDLSVAGDYNVVTPCGEFNFTFPFADDGVRFVDEIVAIGLPTELQPYSGALPGPVQIFAGNGTGVNVLLPGVYLGDGVGTGILDSPLQPLGATTVTVSGAITASSDQFAVAGKVSGCTAANEAPIANPDLETTKVETPVIINVLANDSDVVIENELVDGVIVETPVVVTPAVGTVTIVPNSIAPDGSGTVAVNTDNTVTFTPAIGTAGEASFQYTVTDPCGLISLPATATILVENLLVDEADYRTRTGKWALAGSSSFSDLTMTEAGVTTFLSALTGAQEVPPNQSLAKGFATVSMAEVAPTTLDISVRVDPLPGSAITAAHIHTPAGVGVNAPAVVDICGTATTAPCTPVNGQLIVELVGVAAEAATITAIQNGNAYVNVHTVDIPGGEIRGQLGVNVISLRSGADGTGPVIDAVEVQAGAGTSLPWSFDGRAATSPGAAPFSIQTESGLGNTETRTLRLR